MFNFSNILTKIAHYGFTSRSRFYRKLSTLMKNGKQLQVAIHDLQKRAARKGSTDVEAIALSEILHRMQGGESFANSMQNFITVNERMVLDSGEESGDLTNALELCAEIIEASSNMRSNIINAVASPMFLVALLIGVLILLSRVVMPKLTAVLSPSKWDTTARMLYEFTQIINSPWLFLFFGILFVAVVVIGFSLFYWTGTGRRYFDQIPPWSIFRLFVGSGWILSLASLVHSGETILNSLQNMQKVSGKNRWLNDRINGVIFYYNSGLNLGEALEATETDFPDKEIVDDLVTYANMQGFDEILYSLGRDWIKQGVEKIKIQASLLNTVAIVLVGLVLGWFTYAVISIQMSMGSHLSGM